MKFQKRAYAPERTSMTDKTIMDASEAHNSCVLRCALMPWRVPNPWAIQNK